MSVKFLLVILGPEMAAPILWVPGIFVSFCRKTLHAHAIPRLRGGLLGGGGGSAFFFCGRGDFSEHRNHNRIFTEKRLPPRIWISLWAPLMVTQCRWPYN